jgi:hypothetical protein
LRWGTTEVGEHVAELDRRAAPLRAAIARHRVYEMVDDGAAIRVFMEHHVVAVWDFMSLLKALQAGVTCVSVPWVPRGDASHRRFVNELVVAEESDLDPRGGHVSHFELYVDAMREAGAQTRPILALLDHASDTEPGALAYDGLPPAAAAFAQHTLAVATSAPLHGVAAAFAFGRERLIPDMFTTIRIAAERHQPRLDLLLTYLDRHIVLDSDVHTPLAFQLVDGLCGDHPDRWREAEEAALAALQRRLELWDATAQAIERGAARAGLHVPPEMT